MTQVLTHCTIVCNPDFVKNKVIELFPYSKLSYNHQKITVYPSMFFDSIKTVCEYKKHLSLQLGVKASRILFTTKEKIYEK